jgi:exonuclease SbcC
MWIKQLRIENFQSHKETVLDFHPNFNCIVGTGNSGKSAIVRALSFILFGQWESSWVRNGAAFCRIALVMDNQTVVIREKGEKVNRYVVRVPELPEQIYSNFGTHVPEEIEKLLHIFKAQVGDKEEINLNLSSQLDNLFLLSNPGAYKAKVLGKLSKAHYLDYALREINRDKKRLSGEKTVLEKEVLDLGVELVQFDHLDAEKIQLEKIGQRIESLSQAQERLEKLKELFGRVSSWKQDYTVIKQLHAELQSITVTNTDNLIEKFDSLKKIRALFDRVQRFSTVYKSTKTLLEDTTTTERLSKEKYVAILQKNQKCPTCFGSIDDHTCQQILENLNA